MLVRDFATVERRVNRRSVWIFHVTVTQLTLENQGTPLITLTDDTVDDLTNLHTYRSQEGSNQPMGPGVAD